MSDTTRELAIFDYEGSQVRTSTHDGKSWFALSDVCKILGIGNPRDVARRIPARHKGVDTIDTLGGPQKMRVISEPGLFRAILLSRKPEAEAFIDWLTEEVLPAIKSTGVYVASAEVREMLGLNAKLEDEVVSKEVEVEKLKREITALQAALSAANRVTDALLCDHEKTEDGRCIHGRACVLFGGR